MSRSRAYSTGSLPSDEHFTHEEQERRLAELVAWFNVTCPDNSCKVPKHPPLLKTTLSSSPTLYDWDTMYSNYRTAFIENKSQRIPLLTALAEDTITYGINAEDPGSLMPKRYFDMYINLFFRMKNSE
jgi:hypothetical protein